MATYIIYLRYYAFLKKYNSGRGLFYFPGYITTQHIYLFIHYTNTNTNKTCPPNRTAVLLHLPPPKKRTSKHSEHITDAWCCANDSATLNTVLSFLLVRHQVEMTVIFFQVNVKVVSFHYFHCDCHHHALPPHARHPTQEARWNAHRRHKRSHQR